MENCIKDIILSVDFSNHFPEDINSTHQMLKKLNTLNYFEWITVDLVKYLHHEHQRSSAFNPEACQRQIWQLLSNQAKAEPISNILDPDIQGYSYMEIDEIIDTLADGINITPTSNWLEIWSSINIKKQKIYIRIQCNNNNPGASSSSETYIETIFKYLSDGFKGCAGACYNGGYLDSNSELDNFKLQDFTYGKDPLKAYTAGTWSNA